MANGQPARRGRPDIWYEDDQVSASMASPGTRAARQERATLLVNGIEAWAIGRGLQRRLTALDAGCGDGINLPLLTQVLGQFAEECNVVALDRWEGRTKKAAEFGVAVVSGDVESLPLEESSVDFVLLSHVLEHVSDPAVVLDEVKRVVRPGGCVLIAVPNEGCLLAQLRNRVLQRVILSTTDHVHFFTMASLAQQFEQDSDYRLLWKGREGFFVPHLRLQSTFRNLPIGRWVLRWLATLLPSQSAGIAVSLEVLPKPRSGGGKESPRGSDSTSHFLPVRYPKQSGASR